MLPAARGLVAGGSCRCGNDALPVADALRIGVVDTVLA